MFSFITGLILSVAILVGFPKLPPVEQLVQQSFGMCVSGDFVELDTYQTQTKPVVFWTVYKDVDGKTLAILILVDDVFTKAYILKDGQVLEFNTFEELLKVSQSPCDLLPKRTL